MSPHRDSPVVSASAINHCNGNSCSDNEPQASYLQAADSEPELDLVCVGFGPASLAIAVAMHDAVAAGTQLTLNSSPPKVLFLEKQMQFAWHAGMLLPGAKMQISFIKDLATLRNPRSEFTFLNYLHRAGRLVEFTNLNTFLPSRVEYEDYLRWCASHFDHIVQYDQEVLSISPEPVPLAVPVKHFTVASREGKTGRISNFRTRNVLLAIGGQPSIPKSLPANHPRVIHSSQYAHIVPSILTDQNAPYRVAVVGAGQSAAEIFNNIQVLYPNSRTWLIMRSEFLKPSDDSPFVNSMFNPSYTDSIFSRSSLSRQNLLNDVRNTNYGVVRLELIESLYERMYEQRREYGSDETKWPHCIVGGYQIIQVDPCEGSEDGRIRVHVESVESLNDRHLPSSGHLTASAQSEILDVDLIISATGYQRNAHLDLMKDAWCLLPESSDESVEVISSSNGWLIPGKNGSPTRKLDVGRDYRVRFEGGKVASNSGVWLQGCCEGTHGLSDTLLSVLANRSSEIVQSMFGNKAQ